MNHHNFINDFAGLILGSGLLTSDFYEQHVSCKVALVMLKHFSNPSEDHPNNYWGNLELIEKERSIG